MDWDGCVFRHTDVYMVIDLYAHIICTHIVLVIYCKENKEAQWLKPRKHPNPDKRRLYTCLLNSGWISGKILKAAARVFKGKPQSCKRTIAKDQSSPCVRALSGPICHFVLGSAELHSASAPSARGCDWFQQNQMRLLLFCIFPSPQVVCNPILLVPNDPLPQMRHFCESLQYLSSKQ